MRRTAGRGAVAIAAAFALALLVAAPGTAPVASPSDPRVEGRPVPELGPMQRAAVVTAAPLASARSAAPRVTRSIRNDTSVPLTRLPRVGASRIVKAQTEPQTASEGDERALPNRMAAPTRTMDPVLQASAGSRTMPAPIENFPGISNGDNVRLLSRSSLPPDPNGDIGGGYYVQVVNSMFAVWNASGTLLYGPVATSTLWSGFGGMCQSHDDGDPIVLYDALAGRWMMSQFAIQAPNNFHQCIAVSKSADPRGAWNRYDFKYSSSLLNDYPKFGVWPDGYYMSTNQFDGDTDAWAGAGAVVYERSQMLKGLPARQVYFNLGAISGNLSGMLPSNLNGVAPPAGTPNIFAQIDDDAWGYARDQLELWKFRVAWAKPAASTFTRLTTLPVARFSSRVCPDPDCAVQPGTAVRLDSLTDRLMNRLQYRKFPDHQTLVLSHTVAASSGRSGVRWYELRSSGGSWTVYQQGTYAPGVDSRWMGSVAMDRSGDIAAGYSISGSNSAPSVAYAGRRPGDPAGTLPAAQRFLVHGAGSQTGGGRWGDYSSLSVDPRDGCTFWYTQEYYGSNSPTGWSTRIGSFRFPSCG